MDDPWQAGEDEDDRRTHGCRDQYEIKHVANLLALAKANWVGASRNAESMETSKAYPVGLRATPQ